MKNISLKESSLNPFIITEAFQATQSPRDAIKAVPLMPPFATKCAGCPLLDSVNFPFQGIDLSDSKKPLSPEITHVEIFVCAAGRRLVQERISPKKGCPIKAQTVYTTSAEGNPIFYPDRLMTAINKLWGSPALCNQIKIFKRAIAKTKEEYTAKLIDKKKDIPPVLRNYSEVDPDRGY